MGSTNAAPAATDTTWRTEEWELIRRRRQVAFGGSPSESDPSPMGSSTDAGAGMQDEIESARESGADEPPNQTDEPRNQLESKARPRDLVGLALSGGGLRSAFFNDGLLQALSHRGLLRYVDYLCSVSGGGYIAGHLITKTRLGERERSGSTAPTADATPWNFHEDRGDANSAPAWHFGRDPDTGQECAERLPGIGAYLQRSFRFFAGYALRQLPIFLLYLSFIGLLAALLAIGFRSYDAPLFRSLYLVALGVRFGNELLIAFIPPLFALTVTLLLALVAWCPLSGLARVRAVAAAQDRLRWCAKCGFWLTIILAATSVAVYLGNDLTKATSDSSVASHQRLNQFAVQMTILAAAIQLLVFLGSDRLLRSEQSEAAKWKKSFQAVVSNGVVAFAIFTMVHLMARENLSGYTHRRDPALVTGDVSNWPMFVSTVAKLVPRGDKRSPEMPDLSTQVRQTIEFVDLHPWAETHLLGISPLYRHDRFLLDEEAIAYPDSPLIARDRREATDLLSVGQRYTHVVRACLPLLGRFPADQRISLEAGGNPLDPSFQPARLPTDARSFRSICQAVDQAHANAERYLHDHNPLLHSSKTTDRLLDLIAGQGNPDGISDAQPLAEALLEHPLLKNNLASLAASHRLRLQNLLTMHFVGGLGSVEPERIPTEASAFPWRYRYSIPESVDREQLRGSVDRAWLNVFLLSTMTAGEDRGMLRPFHVASTWVVQSHDQRSRWRWVVFWSSLLVISLLLTANLNRNYYLFAFYHHQIREAFLKGSTGQVDGDTPITQIRPWENGLPFPIYLTAGMVESGEGRGIVPEGIALSPLGATHGGLPRYHRVLDAYDDTQHSELTLAKAVATSGAAITPLMTNTMALRVMMDFFGARLGYRMRFVDRQAKDPGGAVNGWSWGIAIVVSVIAVYFFGLVLPLAIEASKLAIAVCCSLLAVTTVIAWQLHRQTGYPALLVDWWRGLDRKPAVAAPPEPAPTTSTDPTPQTSRDDRSWEKRPGVFVADGGFYDYLGVSELLRRRCELIIVSDAGINSGSTTMEALASMCEQASSELGVRFVQLDHDMPIEYARLQRDEDQTASQTFLAMRVKYPELPGRSELPREGLLFYVQMSITERDPIEIQQIRHRFPSFPDEPTTNQFYTPEQVAAYRDLGYHIGNRLCNHLHRWDSDAIWSSVTRRLDGPEKSQGKPKSRPAAHQLTQPRRLDPQPHPARLAQPLFCELKRRLTRAYVQACYEEHFFSEDDVFGESVWRDESRESVFPSFDPAWRHVLAIAVPRDAQVKLAFAKQLTCLWLDEFQRNADVFSRYLEAVNQEVNRLHSGQSWEAGLSPCGEIARDCLLLDSPESRASGREQLQSMLLDDVKYPEALPRWTAHLAVVAASAQQLHRGTPHQVFQVGGREKLTDVMEHLVTDIRKALVRYRDRLAALPPLDETNTETDADPRRVDELLKICDEAAEAIIHETYELAESVFQGADRVAVVSFVQCLSSEIAASIRWLSWRDADHDGKALCEATGRHLGSPRPSDFQADSSAAPAKYLLPHDFRQLMFDKLQSGYRSHAKKLIAAYLRFLCTGVPDYNEDSPVVPQRILNVSNLGTAVKRPRKG